MQQQWVVLQGEASEQLKKLPDSSCRVCVTSPPYYHLREHNHPDQLGWEATPQSYVERLVGILEGVRRVLTDDGTLWLNIGSTYAGSGRGPTGWNGIGDQSVRQGFVDTRRAPSYGNGGRERRDSPVPDYAYSRLCDECLGDFLTRRARIADNNRPLLESSPHSLRIDRDSGHLDVAGGTSDDVLLGAQGSTSFESWLRRPRDECSRCSSRASFLDGLDAASLAARLSVGTAEYRHDIASPVLPSSARTGGTYPSSSAQVHSSSTSLVPPGYKRKDNLAIPERLVLAMIDAGWYYRSPVVWAKTNAMPGSYTDRPTLNHEMIYMFSKTPFNLYRADQVRQPALNRHNRPPNGRVLKGHRAPSEHSRNHVGENFPYESDGLRLLRTVWSMRAADSYGAGEGHYSTFPVILPDLCIRASSLPGDLVLDPFSGTATTGVAALRLGRRFVGIELLPEFAEVSKKRLVDEVDKLCETAPNLATEDDDGNN